ncbi:hypothetical protein [Streptomyces alfalfae]
MDLRRGVEPVTWAAGGRGHLLDLLLVGLGTHGDRADRHRFLGSASSSSRETRELRKMLPGSWPVPSVRITRALDMPSFRTSRGPS